MTPTGFEPTRFFPENQGVLTESGALCGALGDDSGRIDAELKAVIDAWPAISEATRRAILGLIDAEGE